MFAMYNPTAFGVGFVSFDVKFGEEARKFVKIRIPLCASETVVRRITQKENVHAGFGSNYRL